MKKIAVLIAVILMATSLAACKDDSTAQIILDKEVINMTLFGETELVASYTGLEGEIAWENTAPDIVSMETIGNVAKLTAISAGIATINASGGGASDGCRIVVAPTSEKLVLETDREGGMEIIDGSSHTIGAEVFFGGVSFDKATVKYSSSDENVVVVSDSGVVTAAAPGTANITVLAEYFGMTSNECVIPVTVSAAGTLLTVNAANLTLYEPSGNESYPESFVLEVALQGEDGVVPVDEYTVSNSNSAVAVLEEGQIRAVSAGSTEIKISFESESVNYEATVKVTVEKIPVVVMNISDETITIFSSAPTSSYRTAAQLTANAQVNGKYLAADVFSWEVTSGAEYVTVSQTGIVAAVSSGEAEVTVSMKYGGNTYSKTCAVTVAEPAEYKETDKFWDRSGVLTSINAGAQLNIENVSLSGGKDTPFIRLQKIPYKMLTNADKYPTVGGAPFDPIAPDNRTLRDLRMFYITLTDAEDENNYITIAVRVYISLDGFGAEAGSANIGVRASTFPAFTPGQVGYSDFYGAFNGDAANPNSPFGISGGFGAGAAFSFYGLYLPTDTTDKYSLGFSVEGTAIYMHNNNAVTKIWDLKEDTLKYAETYPDAVLKADNAWEGFTSDKVNISIFGDHFEANATGFRLMITDLEGKTVTAADAGRFEITAIG